jgi:hypothetical protein
MVIAGCALSAVLVLGSCAPHLEAPVIDPEVDFAAHVDRRGIVVDRMAEYDTAVLVPHGSLFSRGPAFLLQFDDHTIAALWFEDRDHVVVRKAADPNARVIGEVEEGSQHGAIRLTFNPAEGPGYRTGRFHRVDMFARESGLLGPQVATNLDLRGVYQAQVRDARGKAIGWLRVSIETDRRTPRIYNGVLPEEIDGSLAAAAVELINAEVDDIEHRAVDVHRGN